jgi:hypothetical protein
MNSILGLDEDDLLGDSQATITTVGSSSQSLTRHSCVARIESTRTSFQSPVRGSVSVGTIVQLKPFEASDTDSFCSADQEFTKESICVGGARGKEIEVSEEEVDTSKAEELEDEVITSLQNSSVEDSIALADEREEEGYVNCTKDIAEENVDTRKKDESKQEDTSSRQNSSVENCNPFANKPDEVGSADYADNTKIDLAKEQGNPSNTNESRDGDSGTLHNSSHGSINVLLEHEEGMYQEDSEEKKEEQFDRCEENASDYEGAYKARGISRNDGLPIYILERGDLSGCLSRSLSVCCNDLCDSSTSFENLSLKELSQCLNTNESRNGDSGTLHNSSHGSINVLFQHEEGIYQEDSEEKKEEQFDRCEENASDYEGADKVRGISRNDRLPINILERGDLSGCLSRSLSFSFNDLCDSSTSFENQPLKELSQSLNRSVRFSDVIDTKDVSNISDLALDILYYNDDELAEMRYEAFMEKVGLDPQEFD